MGRGGHRRVRNTDRNAAAGLNAAWVCLAALLDRPRLLHAASDRRAAGQIRAARCSDEGHANGSEARALQTARCSAVGAARQSREPIAAFLCSHVFAAASTCDRYGHQRVTVACTSLLHGNTAKTFRVASCLRKRMWEQWCDARARRARHDALSVLHTVRRSLSLLVIASDHRAHCASALCFPLSCDAAEPPACSPPASPTTQRPHSPLALCTHAPLTALSPTRAMSGGEIKKNITVD